MVSAVMSMIVPGRVEVGVVASSVDLVAGRTAGGTARGTAGETTAGADTLSLSDPYTVPTTYWHRLDDGRIQCDVCPRACKLHEGQRGLCFVRGRVDDQIVLASYGRSSGSASTRWRRSRSTTSCRAR